MVYHSSDPTAIVSAAVGLIDRIAVQMDRRGFLNGLRDHMVVEFGSLQQTLILTKLTILKYDHTPLGHGLGNTITPTVVQCFIVLQELLGSLNGTRSGLNFTSIGDLWRQVWWSRWEGDEFASSRKKLSESRQSLQAVLLASNSYVFLGHV
jgi:hypothetical protein